MTVTLTDRFAAKTQRADNGCLRWTGAHNSIDHVAARGCIYKDCVEPTHLETVTARENNLRKPGVRKTHCIHGHELTDANLIVKRRANGHEIRNCRTCNNDQQRVRDMAKRYGIAS